MGNNGKDENLSPYSWSKSKNIELIKNYSKWFGLKYELVYFYNVYGEGQIKNSEMAAVIGIFEELYKKGFFLSAIHPPTVPKGKSRLRISLTLNIKIETIKFFLNTLFTIKK